jgi:hypothetical protein
MRDANFGSIKKRWREHASIKFRLSAHPLMVDYPGAAYWPEIAAHYSDAKVLHTVRDADGWFESPQATILAPGGFALSDGPQAPFFASIAYRIAGNSRERVHDRAFMVDYFRRNTEAMKAQSLRSDC